MILGTAIAAGADAIVTGDLDLLVLQEYEGIPIVTAREFLERYFSENQKAILFEGFANALALTVLSQIGEQLEERGRILERQAEAMVQHYRKDREWQELEAGDLIDC